MKHFLLIISFILLSFGVSAQMYYRGYRVAYPVRVIHVTQPTRVVYKTKTENAGSPGNIDLRIHCDYNFNNAVQSKYNPYPLLEFGGSISYYFKSNKPISLGILLGYDNAVNQWWIRPESTGYFVYGTYYWDIRAGMCISKYFTIGMTIGEYQCSDGWHTGDLGVFANLNLPIGNYFGIFADGKWSSYQGFSVGGGIFFKIYTD